MNICAITTFTLEKLIKNHALLVCASLIMATSRSFLAICFSCISCNFRQKCFWNISKAFVVLAQSFLFLWHFCSLFFLDISFEILTATRTRLFFLVSNKRMPVWRGRREKAFERREPPLYTGDPSLFFSYWHHVEMLYRMF